MNACRHGKRLRRDQGPVPIPSINQDPGKWRQNEQGELAGKADQAEQPAGVSQFIDRPAESNLLDPRANEGNALSAEIEAEIPMPKRAQHRV